MGCSELLFPRLLLQMASMLDSIRHLIQWGLTFVGLAHLLADPPEPDFFFSAPPGVGATEFRSISAVLIQELLPVVKYEELAGENGEDEGDGCAVCLCEMEASDQVRRLGNCRHVFHKSCLDRWVEHDQRTCPLCRTPLVPDELRDDFNDRLWAAAALPDSSTYAYYSEYSLSSSS